MGKGKPGFWARWKKKFRKSKARKIGKKAVEKVQDFPYRETAARSVEAAKDARRRMAIGMVKMRATINRLRNRDKRKIPLFLLTFDEIESMLGEIEGLPDRLPSRQE